MNSKPFSSDQELDNATKVSTRLHSFYLYSQSKGKALAMAQTSAMRIYRFCDLGVYEESITLAHEPRHIGDPLGTHFKKLTFFADLSELLKTNTLTIIDSSNSICLSDLDIGVMKKWLEESHFRSFMEASAVFSQCISESTPVELKTCIWNDLPLYSKDTVNYYLRLQDIVDKLLDRYRGSSKKYDPVFEDIVKDVVVQCVLRPIYAYTKQLDEKLKILEDTQQSEIPEWITKEQLYSYLDRNILGNNFPHPFPFMTLNNLLQFVIIMQSEALQPIMTDFAFGMCQDFILPFGHGLFPVTFFSCEDKNLSSRKIVRCYKQKFVLNKEEILRYGKPAFEQGIKSSQCPELSDDYKHVVLMKRQVERRIMGSLIETIESSLNPSLAARDCTMNTKCMGKNQCPLAIAFTQKLMREWRKIFPEIIRCYNEETKVDIKLEEKTDFPPISTL